jgi:ABC-type transporter MlaC component
VGICVLGDTIPTIAGGAMPTATVQILLGALESYKTRDGVPLSAADRQHNAEILRIAGESLGTRRVAEQALGSRWATLAEVQRREFLDVFSALLEQKAYPKSAAFFADLKVEYLGETIKGDRGVVETAVVHPEEGEISIDYRLERTSNGWAIVDVLLDGASLTADMRTQVQKVLADDSFAGLIRRMKKRLTEE